MKRLTYLIIVIALLMSLLVTSCNTSLDPAQIVSATQDTVNDVEEYNGDVFAEIQTNIDKVNTLKAKMLDANLSGNPLTLEETIKDVEAITKSYEKLASHKAEILKKFTDKIKNLTSMQKSVDSEISILNRRIDNYNKQLANLNSTTSDAEMVRTRTKALNKAIDYVNSQIKLWNQFSKLEGDINTEMNNVIWQVNDFLSVIDSSAILFREGLNLLKLQKNIDDALSLFTVDMPTVQRLTMEMENSWDNLDYLVNSLTSVTTSLNINQN